MWESHCIVVICEGEQRIYVTDVDYKTDRQRFIGRWMKTTATDDADDDRESER